MVIPKPPRMRSARPSLQRGVAPRRDGSAAAPAPASLPLRPAMRTMSGPASLDGSPQPEAGMPANTRRKPRRRALGSQARARALPHQRVKAPANGLARALAPRPDEQMAAGTGGVTAGAVTEGQSSQSSQSSPVVDTGLQARGCKASDESLDGVRVDVARQMLSTPQNARKAGLHEKLPHVGHERMPERIVRAHGPGAHGHFECCAPLRHLPQAAPSSAEGKQTPVFVRFSSVGGERGSTDTVRDVRDPTQLVPEEALPLPPAGRPVLTHKPDHVLAETEQVDFCAAHLIPGIASTSDPPPRARLAHERNSLGGDCPSQAGCADALSAAERRRVALLCHEGMDGASMRCVQAALLAAGAVPRLVGRRLGGIATAADGDAGEGEGEMLQVEVTMEAAPSVRWDAVVLPDVSPDSPIESPAGPQAAARHAPPLHRQPDVVDFVREQFRHCKPMLLLGEAVELLRAAGVPEALLDGGPRQGLFRCETPDDPALQIDVDSVCAFITSLARHRYFEREAAAG